MARGQRIKAEQPDSSVLRYLFNGAAGALPGGPGSNLCRLGVPDKVLRRILRHANVSTTATYYFKTAAVDVRSVMMKLENHIA